MLKKSLKFIFPVLSLLPSLALADDGVTLAQAANVLLAGGNVLTKVMWAACIIVGIALIAAGFTQFQIHRRNPKLVPLTTPVMYLILGVAAVAIPFINRITNFARGDTVKVERAPAVNQNNYGSNPRPVDPNDIDAPIEQ